MTIPTQSATYARMALPAPSLPGGDMSGAPYHVGCPISRRCARMHRARAPITLPPRMADDEHVPAGRLRRLSRLAYLTARTTGDLLAAQARRKFAAAGGPRDDLRKAGERILATLGELKGAALKLGQALAMDPDALPEEARIGRLRRAIPSWWCPKSCTNAARGACFACSEFTANRCWSSWNRTRPAMNVSAWRAC